MELEEATIQEKLENGYQSLLLGYASGTLNEAETLAVAVHLSYSPAARAFIRNCEAIGGSLMESGYCGVSMSEHSLENVLERLENTKSRPKTDKNETFADKIITFPIPATLAHSLKKQKTITWKSLLKGFRICDLRLECKKSHARLIHAEPGVKIPHHSHGSAEITILLDGAYSDETGTYKKGDLIVMDESIDHTPVACKTHGCTCLLVSDAPIKLHGITRLLNPFLPR